MSIPKSIEFEARSADPTETVPSGEAFFYLLGTSFKYKDDQQNINTLSTGVTAEEVQDIVGSLIQGGAGIEANYDDGANLLIINIEPTTLQTIQTALQPLANISELTNDTGFITSAQAPVQSVNGQTGAVVTGFTKFVEFFQNVVSYTNNDPVFTTVYSWTTPSLQIGTYLFEAIVSYEPSQTGSNDLFRLAEGTNDLAVQLEYEDEGKDVGSDIRRNISLAGRLIVTAGGSKTLTIRGAQDSGAGGTTVVKGAMLKLEQYS